MSAKRLATLAGMGAVMGAIVAVAGIGAAPAAAYEQAKTSASDGSRRVCRNVTPVGSRLTRRICRTQAEWDEAEYRTQDGVLQHQRTQTTTYEQNSPR